jgi:hypothetical protein
MDRFTLEYALRSSAFAIMCLVFHTSRSRSICFVVYVNKGVNLDNGGRVTLISLFVLFADTLVIEQ